MKYINASTGNFDYKSNGIIANPLTFVFQFCMLFFFVSEFPIYGFLTSRRVVLVIAALYLFFNNSKIIHLLANFSKNRIRLYILLFFIVLLISLINSVIYKRNNANEYFEYWYVIYQFLYVFIVGLYCIISFKCFKNFAQILVVVFIVQSIAILMAVLNPEVRIFLYKNFYFSDSRFDNAVLEWGTRIVGINLHSSTGSVCMSTGVLALIFLRIKNEIKDLSFYSLSIIIMLGTAFIGRLGLLIEIIGFVAYFIIEKKNVKNIILGILVGILSVILANMILSRLNPVIAEFFSTWISGAFNGSGIKEIGSAINGLQATPEFSIDWFFGTGVIFGTTPTGEVMHNDSGYVKSLVGIGIFGSLAYYFAYYFLLIAPHWKVNKKSKTLMSIIIILTFIIEYKEPFMMKYIFSFFAFVCSGFLAKEGGAYNE